MVVYAMLSSLLEPKAVFANSIASLCMWDLVLTLVLTMWFEKNAVHSVLT